ncbi:MAG: ribD [Ferruginibacter sp.]|nr:ribD [Ferruginibacter sp.]
MQRCFALARLGAGKVAPNPMVGAVLLYNDRIIGEGFHEYFGGPHAEVNCIASVKDADRSLISESILYVSLEPCNHFGKTPPCSALIIKENIKKVVISCRDPFAEVNGAGIQRLKDAGVEVVSGILESKGSAVNKRFFTFHEQQRPYIILKWAESANGKISGEDKQPVRISNALTNRLVHKWRAEEAAIVVGTQTVLSDDPSLTTRLWPGNNPVRVTFDLHGRLNKDLRLLSDEFPAIIINNNKDEASGNKLYNTLAAGEDSIGGMLRILYERKILSAIIEGGATLLNAVIASGYWDEARIIRNSSMLIAKGTDAPVLKNARLVKKEKLLTDTVAYYVKEGK